MRVFFAAFVNSSFGHAPDGSPVFMPFGKAGASYLIDTQEHLERMRRQLGWLSILPAASIIGIFALALKPIRQIAFAPILLLIVGSLIAFVAIFLVWVRLNIQSMAKLQAEDCTLVQMDPIELAAAAIRRHLSLVIRSQDSSVLFSTAGALAGFACQIVVRDRAMLEGRSSGLIEVSLNDGRVLYLGDVLNGPLAEDVPSVWSIVGGGAPVSDIYDIFKDAVGVLTEDPCSSTLKALLAGVQRHWPKVVAILVSHNVPVTSRHLAIARAIRMEQLVRDSQPSARVTRTVMAAAILLAKWDPADILVPDQVDATTFKMARS